MASTTEDSYVFSQLPKSGDNYNHSSPQDSKALPSDWPPLGPIDLALHDRAHASAKTEWWYINAHVSSTSSSEYSFFAAFFRVATTNDDGSFTYSHSITWALVDLESKNYYTHASLDHRTPEVLLALEDYDWATDYRVKAAMLEVLKKNRVPLPDRLFQDECSVDDGEQMWLIYGRNEFVAEGNGYRLRLWDENKMAIDVHLKPEKGVQRQGHDGVQFFDQDEAMFYYFVP